LSHTINTGILYMLERCTHYSYMPYNTVLYNVIASSNLGCSTIHYCFKIFIIFFIITTGHVMAQVVSCILARRPRFNFRPDHMTSMVDEVALEQVFYNSYGPPLPVSLHQCSTFQFNSFTINTI